MEIKYRTSDPVGGCEHHALAIPSCQVGGGSLGWAIAMMHVCLITSFLTFPHFTSSDVPLAPRESLGRGLDRRCGPVFTVVYSSAQPHILPRPFSAMSAPHSY